MAEPDVPPIPAPPPLVGREREQAALRDALVQALAGRGSLVLIGGEAGIGKTALAEATLAKAAEQGALVLIGRCYDLSETPPYGPWTEALAGAPTGEGLPALPAAVLPPGRGVEIAIRDAITLRVWDYLVALAARQPIVLLLDDLHWADPASLDLLRALARRLPDVPLLLLATYRADEVAHDHPLVLLLPALVRESRADRLDLRPLDEAAIAALVVSRYDLRDADRARLVSYLAARTEGNALFLGELLRTLEGDALLRQESTAWVVGDLDRAPVPMLLRHIIEGRAARLDPETRRLLTIAAIIGQEVSLAAWAEVGAVAEDDLLDHAEQASAARLLIETTDGAGVRFPHALIRESLHAGIPAIRRRALHRHAGEVLAARATPDPDAVAYHFQQAGDPRAYAWLDRAAIRAQRASAWITAAERLEAAQVLAERGEVDPRERGWLLLRLAMLRRNADVAQATAHITQAAEQASLAGDALLAAYVRFTAGLLAFYVGDFPSGIAAMSAAVAALDAQSPFDTATRARLRGWGLADDPAHHRATLALWCVLTGRFSGAQALVARATPPPESVAGAGWLDSAFAPDSLRAEGYAEAMLGRPAEARAAAERNAAAYRAAGDHVQESVTWGDILGSIQVPYHADDPAGCARILAETERASALASTSGGNPYLTHIRASLWLVSGQWTELQEAAQVALGMQEGAYRVMFASTLGPFALYRGDRALSRALLSDLPLGAATLPGDYQFREGLALLRLGAAVAVEDHDLPGGRTWLEAHDRWLKWSGAVRGRADGHLGWAACHRAAGDHASARAQAELALTHASDPRQPLALLAAHRTLGELGTDAGRYADATAHLDAAMALAEACAAPYERALTLLARADLRLATGDREGAVAALAESRALLEPLDARPALVRADALAVRLATPAVHAPAALPFGLTAREAEVLTLLAEGLTDPQIGERLFISRNTVNTHVRTIYGKLGVNTRAAAARLALERGLA